MTLDEYLDEATRKPWTPGGGVGGFRGNDCILAIANWWLARTGLDPAEGLRCTYDSEEQSHTLLAEAGGYYGLCSARMDAAGTRTADPEHGDVGIVQVAKAGVREELPGIRYQRLFIVPTYKGWLRLPFNKLALVAAWAPKNV